MKKTEKKLYHCPVEEFMQPLDFIRFLREHEIIMPEPKRVVSSHPYREMARDREAGLDVNGIDNQGTYETATGHCRWHKDTLERGFMISYYCDKKDFIPRRVRVRRGGEVQVLLEAVNFEKNWEGKLDSLYGRVKSIIDSRNVGDSRDSSPQ